jgi:hypothetical protein
MDACGSVTGCMGGDVEMGLLGIAISQKAGTLHFWLEQMIHSYIRLDESRSI